MRSHGKLTGEWVRLGTLLTVMPAKITEQAQEVLQECAEIYIQTVFQLIAEGGEPSWHSLSRQWVKRKGHALFYKGLTGELMQNGICIKNLDKGTYKMGIFAGASPFKVHIKSGMTMDHLSYILQGRLGRPLFGPAWERAKPVIMRKLRQIGGNLFE